MLDLQTLKTSVSLEKVVADLTGQDLTRCGNSIKINCPFPGHSDKTPSFFIYPDSRRFNCFGCGKKGDVFDFVKIFKNTNFRDAVNFLEKNYSPRIPKRKDFKNQRYDHRDMVAIRRELEIEVNLKFRSLVRLAIEKITIQQDILGSQMLGLCPAMVRGEISPADFYTKELILNFELEQNQDIINRLQKMLRVIL